MCSRSGRTSWTRFAIGARWSPPSCIRNAAVAPCGCVCCANFSPTPNPVLTCGSQPDRQSPRISNCTKRAMLALHDEEASDARFTSFALAGRRCRAGASLFPDRSVQSTHRVPREHLRHPRRYGRLLERASDMSTMAVFGSYVLSRRDGAQEMLRDHWVLLEGKRIAAVTRDRPSSATEVFD